MQNTRLNSLINRIIDRLTQLFSNPWRRASLLLISLLLGFFGGNAISTISGQAAAWDVVTAAIVLGAVELTNWIAYGSSDRIRRSLPTEVANALKIGIVYSLFLDAFKLGS